MSTLHTPALFRAPSPGKQKGGRTELKYLLPTGKEEGNLRVYFLFGASDSDVLNHLSPSSSCAVHTAFTFRPMPEGVSIVEVRSGTRQLPD